MDYEQESWDRTKWLENKLVKDAFPLQSIRFDPEEHVGRPLGSDDKSGIRLVPNSLWPASLGETVEFDADLLWR